MNGTFTTMPQTYKAVIHNKKYFLQFFKLQNLEIYLPMPTDKNKYLAIVMYF